jgi:GT2 family glycosyltransferase
MATAIIDLEYNQLPSELTDLTGYDYALILIRLRRRPVGHMRLPVINGRISGMALRASLLEAVDWTFWEVWLHQYLDWEERFTGTYKPPTATVATCTRDRTDDLERLLNGLMQMPDDGQEILVVDNCPATDATQRLVERYPRARYVREPVPGLNNARNRALREAQHDIVAFIDDDAVPDPGWLRNLLCNYEDPLVMSVNGLTMPLEIETKAQEWFERYGAFQRGFQRRVFEKAFANPLDAGVCGAGVNMSFRRCVLDLVGPFDPALDTGTPTRSGGDNEMFSRVLAAGYRIVYDPAALSWHRHRRAWDELRQLLYNYGVGVVAAWVRTLVEEQDSNALSIIWNWIYTKQLRELFYALRGQPSSLPAELLLAQLRGSLAGPWAYLRARRQVSNQQIPD